MKNGAKMYENVGRETEILNADPHRIIQLLMEGFLYRLNAAKGFIDRKDFSTKTVHINKAIEILNGLLVSLDMKKGGEISSVLDELYRFMMRELVTANMKNDPDILERVKNIMLSIKEGWDAIPSDIREQYSMDIVHTG